MGARAWPVQAFLGAEAAGMTLEREEGGVLYFARHTPPT